MLKEFLILATLTTLPAVCFQQCEHIDAAQQYAVCAGAEENFQVPLQKAGVDLRTSMTHLESRRSEKLRVHVIDYASIPPETLRSASRIAEALLRKAGIETEWLPCRACNAKNPCTSPSADTELVVKILAPGMEDPRISEHLLGTTNRVTSVAFVFYGHVRVSKLAGNCLGLELLASVMVHEVGHLLGLEHSAGGIMRERFRPTDIEQGAIYYLTFTGNQPEQANIAISARLEQTRTRGLSMLR